MLNKKAARPASMNAAFSLLLAFTLVFQLAAPAGLAVAEPDDGSAVIGQVQEGPAGTTADGSAPSDGGAENGGSQLSSPIDTEVNDNGKADVVDGNSELDVEVQDLFLDGAMAVSEEPEEAGDVTAGDGSSIDSAAIKWVTEDTSDDGNASNLYYRPSGNGNVSVVGQLDFSLSGEYDYEAGTLQVKLPGHIFKDRDGNVYGKLSLPFQASPSTKGEFNWSYYADGDYYVLTNTRTIAAASSVSIQVAFQELKPSDVVDMAKTDELDAEILLTNHNGNVLNRHTNKITAQIDTAEQVDSATLNSTGAWPTVKTKEQLEKMGVAVPDEYADEEKFVVVNWYTYAYHSGNTNYTFSYETDPEPEGALKAFDGTNCTGNEGGEKVYNKDGRSAYKYLTTCYPLSQFTPDKQYTLTNSVTWSTTETDNGEVSSKTATATRSYTYYSPTEKHPTGHFYNQKWGTGNDDNYTTWYPYYTETPWSTKGTYGWTNYYGKYSNGLNLLSYGQDLDAAYMQMMRGWTLPWTKVEGSSGDEVADYGAKDVTLTLTDGAVKLGGTSDKEELVAGEDYTFSSLHLFVPTIYKAVKYDASDEDQGTIYYDNGSQVWTGSGSSAYGGTYGVGYTKDTDASHIPVFSVYAKVNGGDWQKVADVDWSDGASTKDIALPDGCTDYKVEVTYGHTLDDGTVVAAISDAHIAPHVKLNHESEHLMGLVNTALDEQDDPLLYLTNTDKFTVAQDGKELTSIQATGTDRIYGYNSSISAIPSKESEVSIDNEKQVVSIDYTLKVEERTTTKTLEQYEEAVGYDAIQQDEDGTFYDLLPEGMTVDVSTVNGREGDVVKDAYTIADYNGSGRTLLVVEMDLAPAPEVVDGESGDGNTVVSDIPELTFKATYTFDAMRHHGTQLHNAFAYESGNDTLGNVKDYSGEPDTPYSSNNIVTGLNTTFTSDDERNIMVDLDKKADNPNFVYAGCIDNVTGIYATVAGLSKEVMVNNDGSWGTGVTQTKDAEGNLQDGSDDTQRNVYAGGTYTYRMDLSAAGTEQLSNAVLYDAVEAYVPTSDKADEGDTQWKGTLIGVDTSALEEAGVTPVVYYSTKSGIRIASDTDDSVLSADASDLNNKSIWSTEAPSDMSKVTAVAIDCSKKADGSDFVMSPGDMITAYLKMRAPSAEASQQYIAEENGGTSEDVDGAHAYNNNFASMTSTGFLSQSKKLVRNDYTKVGLTNFSVQATKSFDDADDADGLRPSSVTLKLMCNGEYTGKSVTVDGTVDGNGEVAKWTASFGNLDYCDEQGNVYRYAVTEDGLEGYTTSNKQLGNGTIVVTNVHKQETVKVSGTKTWVGDTSSARPSSIQVELYRDGKVIDTKTVSGAGDTWSYSFGDLPKYHDHGKEYTYEVKEKAVADYVAECNGLDITNTYHPYGDLVVKKTVEDSTAQSADNSFSFAIELSKADGSDFTDTVQYSVLGKDGEVLSTSEFTNGQHVSIKDGQSIKLAELPTGTLYKVTEEDATGYVQATSEQEGSVVSNTTQTAEFVNTYKTSGSVNPKATKTLEGTALKAYMFEFQVTDEDGNIVSIGRNDAQGNVSFSAISYSNEDSGKTFDYVISEVDGGKGCYTYDETTWKMQVVPTDNGDGTMSCTVRYLDAQGNAVEGISFENGYKASGTASLEAFKDVMGGKAEDGQFSFSVYDADGDKLYLDKEGRLTTAATDRAMSATNNTEGSVKFPEVTFTEQDLKKADGTYGDSSFILTVAEDVPDGAVLGDDGYYTVDGDDVEYTGTKRYWKVTLSDAGGGKLNVGVQNVGADGNAISELPVFTNKLADGTLSIQKDVDGENPDPNQDFEFKLKITTPEGTDLSGMGTELEQADTVSAQSDDAAVSEEGVATASVEDTDDGNSVLDTIGGFLSGIFGVTEAHAATPTKGGTLTFDANGGSFADGSTSNKLVYGDPTTGIVTKYSHTDNVSDDGTQSGNYGSNEKKTEVVTIDGAESLTVTVTYGGESANYDWVSIFSGSHADYTAASDYSKADIVQKLGGGSHTSQTKTYTVSGDSVTFAWKSDGSGYGDGYGYYAVVSGTGITQSKDGEYKQPTAPTGKKFDGWTTSTNGDVVYAKDGSDLPTDETLTLYAHYSDWTWIDDWTYEVQTNGGTEYLVLKTYTGDEAELKVPAKAAVDGKEYKVAIGYTSTGSPSQTQGNLYTGTIENLSFEDGVTMLNGGYLFTSNKTIKGIDFTGVDTSKVTNMGYMFLGCSSLTSLDVGSFDTSKVTNMNGMFYNCSSLTSLDVGSFDTSKVTNMGYMFSGCSSLTSLDVGSFDTSKVTNMNSMFLGCSSLTSLDVGSFDTSKVTNMNGMFYNCSSLTSLDVSGFDTSKVTSMGYMFSGPNRSIPGRYGASGSTYIAVIPVITLGDNFVVPSNQSYVFGGYAPETTASGASSNGKWGLGSENSEVVKTSDELTALGKTKGALAGTWYAQANTSKLTYKANGGVGSDTTQTGSGSIELKSEGFYRFGYTQSGWNTSADGKGTHYDMGAPYNLTADATLYAEWTEAENIKENDDGTFTVTLKAGEKLNVTGLPAGSTYEVVESSAPGWTLESSSGASGTISSNENSVATFTNKYTADSTTANIAATKLVDGKSPAGSYTFILKNAAGETVQTKQSSGQAVVFDPIACNAAGTYYYYISEVAGDDETMTYDQHVETVTVTVSDDGKGRLSAEASYDEDGAVFDNTTKPGSLVVEKRVSNASGAYPDAEFGFTVTFSDGGTYTGTVVTASGALRKVDVASGSTVSIPAGGKLQLNNIPAGVRYTVTETSAPDGWALEGSENASGTIGAAATSTAAFTNAWDATGTAWLHASKVLTGRDLASGEFSFVLSSDDDADNANVAATNGYAGDVSDIAFGLGYDQDDIGKTYHYTMREVAGSDGSVEYSSQTYQATVKVSLKDGKLYTEASVNGGAGAVFTNSVKMGSLSIAKSVEKGSEADADKKFAFKVTFSEDGEYAWTSDKGTSGTVKNGDTVEVAASEVVTVSGLPSGSTYAVSEVGSDGWAQVGAEGTTGTIVANETAAASFTNTYSASGYAGISAKKTVKGDSLTADQYSFELVDGAGKTVATASNDAEGNVEFGRIGYTLDDLGGAASAVKTYTMHEVGGGQTQGGVFFDDSVFTAQVTLTDKGNGTIETAVRYLGADGKELSGVPEFANERTEASGSATISVTKAVVDASGSAASWMGKSFEVALSAEEGVPMPDNSKVTLSEDAPVGSFGIDYSLDDLGGEDSRTYTYTVKETVPDGAKAGYADGITYDTVEHTVSVTVANEGGGVLSTSVDYGDSVLQGSVLVANTYSPASLELFKYAMDGDEKKALAGAKFSLYKGSTWAEASANAVASGITDAEGLFRAEGALDVNATYWLVETEAPEGYYLANPYVIEVGDGLSGINVSTSSADGDGGYAKGASLGTVSADADGTVSLEMQDAGIYDMPMSGGVPWQGIGIGALLLAAAGAAQLRRWCRLRG